MNELSGKIEKVSGSGNLVLVIVRVGNLLFKSIEIETPESAASLKEGAPIKLFFKETEVIIATGEVSPISLQNRIPGTVKKVEEGAFIAKLTIATEVGDIESVITTKAVQTLQAFPGAAVTALIKTNEMMLGT
jgi:molybdate transport system regulatory protein